MIQVVPITGAYAGLLALLVLGLALRVVLRRRRHRVGLGDGANADLSQAMRVHANAIENIPTALLLMLCLELNGAGPLGLHILGSALLVARVIHAWGFSRHEGVSFGRYYGTLVTWLVILCAAAGNLYLFAFA